jgi:hypothetical protein
MPPFSMAVHTAATLFANPAPTGYRSFPFRRLVGAICRRSYDSLGRTGGQIVAEDETQ